MAEGKKTYYKKKTFKVTATDRMKASFSATDSMLMFQAFIRDSNPKEKDT